MWNPYSVEITGQALGLNIDKPLPVALKYTINGVANADYNCLMAGSTNNTPALSSSGSLSYEITSPFVLKPGETRVFSPTAGSASPPGSTLTMEPGYRNSGGHYFSLKDSSGKVLVVPGGATIKADAKFDTAYNDRGDGVGIYLNMSTDGSTRLAYRMIYAQTVANEVYPPLVNLAASSLSAAVSAPVPFLSTVFGSRMASKTHLPAKGFVQSSPLVNYTTMGFKSQGDLGRSYGGVMHPVNSPFDYSFIKHPPFDSQLPNASDTSGRGYIVTGFNKSDGLSRCIVAEIPTRPLLSLGELQNWDLRYENPIPPFAFNLIGNSDATPLLPSHKVVNTADESFNENLQHDDSYCANHLLFDDWFFSSIAPNPSSFGSVGGKDLKKTFTDFVSGIDSLSNRAYRPIAADSGAASTATADSIYDTHVKKADAYLSIASRLEVEGMFNVNSTSVTAWRALLGHARNQRVAYVKESGTSWSVDLSEENDYPFSRFSISGDVEASKTGSSGEFSTASEFAGYRVFNENQINKLADEVVKQVRARGPFLSLAEFVNRQLTSSAPDLALSGAIQSALNELAKSSADNPFAKIEATVTETGRSLAQPVRSAEADYKFPAAAAGWSAYGLPGWTRQADILRPLAPILSVRDDTFTIRAYGDARDKNGKIVSRATCEASVRRTREYVDPTDAADLVTPPAEAANKLFGRRFEIVSFRWLSPSEI